MSTAVQTTLPINDTAQVSAPPFSEPYNLVDAVVSLADALVDVLVDTEGEVVQEVKAEPVKKARSTFTRSHTAEADRQARALCRSIAKAGKVDEANYLLHHWFPRKSDALIARAYEAAKTKGAHIVLDMLAYEDRNRKKFGSWDNIPRSIRSLLT